MSKRTKDRIVTRAIKDGRGHVVSHVAIKNCDSGVAHVAYGTKANHAKIIVSRFAMICPSCSNLKSAQSHSAVA